MLNWIYFIFIGTIGWGVSLSLIKVLVGSLDPVEVVMYRMSIGAISLFLLAYILRVREKNIKGWLIDSLVIGTFNMSIPYYLTSFAEKSVTSSLSAVINSLTPLFTVIFGVFIFSADSRINKFHIISFLLGIFGVFLVESGIFVIGGSYRDLMALLLTCACYAISANYFKYKARTKNPLLISAAAALISSLTMLVIKLFYQPAMEWHHLKNFTEMSALLWLGVIGSGLSLYLYIALISRAGPVFVSMVTYLMTVTGVVVGLIWLHEPISISSGFGCISIILSLIFLNLASRQAKSVLVKDMIPAEAGVHRASPN